MIISHIQDFLHHIRFEKRMSEKTCIAYAGDLHDFERYHTDHYPEVSIQMIRLQHLRSWMADLAGEQQLQPGSLKRKASTLKSFFKFLLRTGITADNPAKLLRTPKASRKLPAFLETEQTEKLLREKPELIPENFEIFTRYLIMEILYQTGMRRAELAGLRETDIEFERRQICVLGKRNKERLIPMQHSLLQDIEAYISLKRKIFGKPGDNLLSLKSGKPLYPKYIYNTVRKELEKVSTLHQKSPHVLRHTFATQLSNNGADLSAIKDLLGHSSLAATQIYTHTHIEKLKETYRKAHPKS